MSNHKFSNAILVVVFNYSNCLNNKIAIRSLYERFFKKVIFYSDIPVAGEHEDVHFLSINRGFNTHAIFPHLWIHYKNEIESSSGVFYVMDDCIINTHRLAELDPEKVICNYGKIVPRDEYLSLDGWHWDRPHGIEALSRLFATHALPEISWVCGAFSDYFYIPRRFLDAHLFDLFAKFEAAEVFLEISIPTILYAVTKGRLHHQPWRETVLWREERLKTRDRNYFISMLSQSHLFHPVKFNENSNYLNWLRDYFYPVEKGGCSKCIVITTINPPNGFVLDYSRTENWDLIIVGDSKTPELSYSGINCIFLGLDKQKELFPTLYDKIPLGSYTRKMFGYLYAIKHGYSIIYETDDDNRYLGELDHFDEGIKLSKMTDFPGGDIAKVPMASLDFASIRDRLKEFKGISFTFDFSSNYLWIKDCLPSRVVPHPTTISGVAVQSYQCSEPGFVNLYRVYTDATIWPRGIPPMHPSTARTPQILPVGAAGLSVAVIQGLVDNHPDVDAHFRLHVTSEPFRFEKNLGAEVTLLPSAVCPFNTQNTFWLDPKVFYALYLPTTVTFRYTDILRGFVALYQLWKSGKTVKFTGPSAYQLRNAHDLQEDYASETPMYRTAERVIELLERNKDAQLADIYRILASEGIVDASEIAIVEEWVRLVGHFQSVIKGPQERPPLQDAIHAHRNIALQPHTYIAAAARQALQMSIWSSGQGFAISDQDIDDLRKVRDGVAAAWASVADKLIFLAETRRRNLPRFDGINMLSLGGDCFTRTVLTRWGLKRTNGLGERSGPFDLSVTYPEGVAELLRCDFAGFMDPENLVYSPVEANCTNRRYGINFNHESGTDYAANNFIKLRMLYQSRVANFHAIIAAPKPLFLMIYLPIFMPVGRSHIELTRGILSHIQQRRSGRVSLLVFNAHVPDTQIHVPDFAEDNYEWCNIPVPDPKYVWHDPDWYMSDSGLAHERKVIERVIAHLERTQSSGLEKSI